MNDFVLSQEWAALPRRMWMLRFKDGAITLCYTEAVAKEEFQRLPPGYAAPPLEVSTTCFAKTESRPTRIVCCAVPTPPPPIRPRQTGEYSVMLERSDGTLVPVEGNLTGLSGPACNRCLADAVDLCAEIDPSHKPCIVRRVPLQKEDRK